MTRYRGRRPSRATGSTRARATHVHIEGEIFIDLKKAADVVAALSIGHIKRNVSRGRGGDDRTLAPYSLSYVNWLADAGEDVRVDLRLTGGMLDSLQERDRKMSEGGALLRIGPGSGTSPEMELAEGGGRLTRTGRRGPPHNVVGAFLAKKWPGWLALSQKAVRKIARKVEKTQGVLVSRR